MIRMMAIASLRIIKTEMLLMLGFLELDTEDEPRGAIGSC